MRAESTYVERAHDACGKTETGSMIVKLTPYRNNDESAAGSNYYFPSFIRYLASNGGCRAPHINVYVVWFLLRFITRTLYMFRIELLILLVLQNKSLINTIIINKLDVYKSYKSNASTTSCCTILYPCYHAIILCTY